MQRGTLVIAAVLAAHCTMARAAPPDAFAHPVFAQPFSCMEHWAGNLHGLGDALGTDCVVQELVELNGRTWLRSYKDDGATNENWFGWRKEVLSPCACIVVRVKENTIVNLPGQPGKPPAASIELLQSDGTHYVLAHLVEFRVKAGDSVQPGQPLALVGNNAYARNPHVHIGAWRNGQPLQVRFDQQAMGKLFE